MSSEIEQRLIDIHAGVADCRRLLQELQNEANFLWAQHTKKVVKNEEPIELPSEADFKPVRQPARKPPPRRRQ